MRNVPGEQMFLSIYLRHTRDLGCGHLLAARTPGVRLSWRVSNQHLGFTLDSFWTSISVAQSPLACFSSATFVSAECPRVALCKPVEGGNAVDAFGGVVNEEKIQHAAQIPMTICMTRRLSSLPTLTKFSRHYRAPV